MCVVSMIGDHYNDEWDKWKKLIPNKTVPYPPLTPNPEPEKDFDDFIKKLNPQSPLPTREEFETLKKEVEDLKKLLKRAKEYDEKNNEPDCEIEEKMKFLREVAKLVGVDLDEVFKPKL